MSARRASRFVVGLVAAGSTMLITAPAGVAAGDTSLPGMCSGRSDPSMTLNAHANGSLKYILNLETDAAGHPAGVLILGRGAERLYVDDLCRFWQHLPGQEPEGQGEDVEEGATTAHAVGTGTLKDGTRVLVRTDVRENDEGSFFRVRYRAMGQHGDEGGMESAEEGHEDEAWTRYPVEGWATLDQFKLR